MYREPRHDPQSLSEPYTDLLDRLQHRSAQDIQDRVYTDIRTSPGPTAYHADWPQVELLVCRHAHPRDPVTLHITHTDGRHSRARYDQNNAQAVIDCWQLADTYEQNGVRAKIYPSIDVPIIDWPLPLDDHSHI